MSVSQCISLSKSCAQENTELCFFYRWLYLTEKNILIMTVKLTHIEYTDIDTIECYNHVALST